MNVKSLALTILADNSEDVNFVEMDIFYLVKLRSIGRSTTYTIYVKQLD